MAVVVNPGLDQSGPGRPAVINGTMNSAVYQKILKDNVRPSVCDLKLKRTWVLQQDNDPKHSSKSTSEWLKKNKMKTLEWPSQSPDLNPIEILWHDLKKVVHARKPSNVAELQQFCKDEWAKIPPKRCNRLTASLSLPGKAHSVQGEGELLVFMFDITNDLALTYAQDSQDVVVSALVDSGAAVNLIDHHLVEELYLPCETPLQVMAINNRPNGKGLSVQQTTPWWTATFRGDSVFRHLLPYQSHHPGFSLAPAP
ncbi:hypothetical protein QTP86_002543 [Hemibagrus guttatus]|nr:hypothetical protein QTP86_002543 [Hemibagrus guttatus]